jgi:hypothetical protein
MGKHALLVIALVAGCTHTFAQDAVQPNPLVATNDPAARTSERITITRNDNDLVVPTSQINARQQADQTDPSAPVQYGPMVQDNKVVSFGEYYKWPLKTSASWTMVSRDDLRFHIEIDHKWLEWVDLAGWRAQLVDDQGHVYTPKTIEHRRARILYSGDDALVVYRGNADLEFAAPGLLTANAHWIKLVIDRGADKFEYTWKFQSDVAAR